MPRRRWTYPIISFEPRDDNGVRCWFVSVVLETFQSVPRANRNRPINGSQRPGSRWGTHKRTDFWTTSAACTMSSCSQNRNTVHP